MKNFTERNRKYFSILWSISIWIAVIFSVIDFIVTTVNDLQTNDVKFAFVSLVIRVVMFAINAGIIAIISYIVLLVSTIIPYLAIKGMRS